MDNKKSKFFEAGLKNMETHLKSKSIKAKLIYKEVEIEDETFKIPLHIEGKYDDSEFLIKFSKTLKKENNQPQVLLLINISETETETNYITLLPQTNAQLTFMIQYFQPGITQIKKVLEPIEDKKDTTPPKKDKNAPKK